MADNTLLNVGTGGDTVRDLARQAGTVKTQVVQLDLGGPTANAEVLITAGQQTMAASVPVAIASNQPAISVTGTFFQTTQPFSAAALPLPTGAPTENAGKLQGSMDLLEAILVELRVISIGIAQLGLATPDAPDVLRSELSNFIQ